jgi:hypothetical protein
MKTQEIIILKGCKIAKTEVIDGKLIVSYVIDLPDLPESVEDILNRNWYINNDGEVIQLESDDLNNFSTRERAEGMLALGQLIELASYLGATNFNFSMEFGANTSELSERFKEKYADLIEKTKKIL